MLRTWSVTCKKPHPSRWLCTRLAVRMCIYAWSVEVTMDPSVLTSSRSLPKPYYWADYYFGLFDCRSRSEQTVKSRLSRSVWDLAPCSILFRLWSFNKMQNTFRTWDVGKLDRFMIGVDGSAHALNDDQLCTSCCIHQGCFGIPFFARPACMHVSASRLFA